jgi:hypothetical protein
MRGADGRNRGWLFGQEHCRSRRTAGEDQTCPYCDRGDVTPMRPLTASIHNLARRFLVIACAADENLVDEAAARSAVSEVVD